jgi:hypothetical protein
MLQMFSLKKLFFLMFINAAPYQKEPVSFAATHTAMPPLLIAPLFGYIGCPDVRVRLWLP